MEQNKHTAQSIDEYTLKFTPEIQEMLNTLRKVINEAAPGAKEKISYQMPAFDFHGVLVYYAVCKNHIGFYPTPSGIEAFRNELSDYKSSKGAIQFPLNKPLPYELISKIVQFRVAENTRNAENKMKTKK